MMKRVVCVLLCAVMLFAIAPMAFAADNLEYSGDCKLNENGVLVITGDAVVSEGSGGTNIVVEETAGRITFINVNADSVTVNGGKITAVGETGLSANSLEMNAGVLNASGSTYYGIRAEKGIAINGGKLMAEGPMCGVYSPGEINCTLPVQQGKAEGSEEMRDACVLDGTFTVEGNPATAVWLAQTAACEHKNTVVVNQKPATCTEPGFTGNTICDDCLTTIKTGSELEALGHIYYDGKCLRCDKPDPSASFTDLKGTIKDYKTAIVWASDNGIANGYKQSDGTSKFFPNHLCTRAQVVTFIWRANGSPEPERTDNPFSDVESSSPFYKAILWAAENGITTGYADGTFRPNSACTRAFVVTFIWRSEAKQQSASKTKFSDISGLNADFTSAITWAAEKGIATGYSDGTFRPNNVCTRAQVVTFIYRDMNGK